MYTKLDVPLQYGVYSVSPSPGSDIARLFARHQQRVCTRAAYKLRVRAYITARRWRDGV